MRSALLAAALAVSSTVALACDTHGPGKAPKSAAADRASVSTGVVREVEPEHATITLSHGRIASLKMAPMSSMVFMVAPGIALDGLEPGARVRFRAALVDGKPTVIRIDPAR